MKTRNINVYRCTERGHECIDRYGTHLFWWSGLTWCHEFTTTTKYGVQNDLSFWAEKEE
jgi:hypothetical protein